MSANSVTIMILVFTVIGFGSGYMFGRLVLRPKNVSAEGKGFSKSRTTLLSSQAEAYQPLGVEITAAIEEHDVGSVQALGLVRKKNLLNALNEARTLNDIKPILYHAIQHMRLTQ